MQLQSTEAENESWYDIYQPLPSSEAKALRGKTVTMGAWIWATRPLTGGALILYDGQSYFSQKISIDTSPAFYAMTATLAEGPGPIQLILTHVDQNKIGNFNIYYDGVVLVLGEYPLDQAPHFNDTGGRQGTWGGQAFTNLIRNPSFEYAGPGIQPWAQKFVNKLSISTMPPSIVLGSLLNWKATGWFFILTAQTLFRTFWAKFGWGQIAISLPFINRPYLLLGILTLIGLGGAVMAFYRNRRSLPWPILIFLGLALVGVWGQTFLRGILSVTPLTPPLIFIVPVARYACPAIIPTLLVLNSGWLEIRHCLERWTRLSHYFVFATYFLFFIGLDIAALVRIAHLYG